MRPMRDIFTPKPGHGTEAAFEHLTKAAKTATKGPETPAMRCYDAAGYIAWVNTGKASLSPSTGIVVDPGCVVIAKDGFPCALLTEDGCCVLSAAEPIADIVNRFLPNQGGKKE